MWPDGVPCRPRVHHSIADAVVQAAECEVGRRPASKPTAEGQWAFTYQSAPPREIGSVRAIWSTQ